MAKPTFPSDRQNQFMLRMPDGMRERIKMQAERNGRSMNAEIIFALDAAFPAPEPTRLSLQEVIRLQEAWQDASGLSTEERPATSDILREVWKIQTGDDADVNPKVRDAVRAVLDEIGAKR